MSTNSSNMFVNMTTPEIKNFLFSDEGITLINHMDLMHIIMGICDYMSSHAEAIGINLSAALAATKLHGTDKQYHKAIAAVADFYYELPFDIIADQLRHMGTDVREFEVELPEHIVLENFSNLLKMSSVMPKFVYKYANILIVNSYEGKETVPVHKQVQFAKWTHEIESKIVRPVLTGNKA